MQRLLRRLWSTLWLAFALVVIVLALGLGTLRLLLPLVPEYRADIQEWAAQALHRPVKIEDMAASWHGLGPVIELKGVDVLSREGDQTLLTLRELHLGVNLLDLMRHWTLRPSHIRVVGTQLIVERLASGKIRLRDFQPHPEHSLPPPPVIAAWMLSQPRLTLADSALAWQDHMTGRQVRVENVALELVNQGKRHQLSAEGELPAALGEHLTLKADLTGPADAPERWSGQVYASGNGLALPGWWSWFGRGDLAVADGQANAVELWVQWRDGSLAGITGVVDGQALAVQGPKHASLRLDRFSGRFRWRREGDGWTVALDRFALARGGHQWPMSRMSARVEPGLAGGARRVAARASYVRLEDARALMALAPRAEGRMVAPVGDLVKDLAPRGELRDLSVTYDGTLAPGRRLALDVELADLAVEAYRRLPGIEGLDARIQVDGAKGALTLTTRDGRLTLPGVFRQPLPVARADGTVRWQRSDAGLRVASTGVELHNADVQGRVGFELVVPEAGVPRLDLEGDYRAGDAAKVPRYLPAKLIPDKALRWLDQAFPAGEITDGHVRLAGPLDAFPYDGGEGRFEVRFGVEDGVFNYRPSWPALRDVGARVRFTGRALEVRGLRGRIRQVAVEGKADVADLAHPVVDVSGAMSGPVGDMLAYLAQGPGQDKAYGAVVRKLDASGRARLGLDLHVDVGRETDYRGVLHLENVAVSVPDWPAGLTGLEGALTFTPRSLQAERIRGALAGAPVTLAAHTEGEGAGRVHVVEANGQLATGVWPERVARHLRGAAPARVRLTVPGVWQPGDRMTVRVTSDLEGLAVDLPAPLSKDADDSQRLDAAVWISQAQSAEAQIRYGDVSGHMPVSWAEGPVRIRGLRIELGGGTASPATPGVIRIEGRCPRLSVADWAALAGEGEASAHTPLDTIQADLKVARFETGTRVFHNASIEASRTERLLEARFHSQEVAGRVDWQLRPQGRPLYVNLRYLNLSGGGDEAADGPASLDPRRIPPLRVQIDQFSYKGVPLGRLGLDTEPAEDGLRIVGLDIEGERLNGVFEGHWRAADGRRRTELDGRLRTPDITALLSAFGYAGAVQAKESEARFSLSWPADPGDFGAAGLNGELDVRLDDGRLLEVSPGAGRVFGLLSLQTLPRRLSLDFTDVVSKGLAFDRVQGHFRIADGVAHTDDLVLVGPAARVGVSGRVGLVDEDFDQLVTVIPSVSSSLPVAGTIAGGPGVGAVLYLTQKLFKRQIDSASALHYRVQGSWSDPTVKQIEAPAGEPDTE